MEYTNSQKKAIEDIREFIKNPALNVWCLSGSPGTGKSFIIQHAIPKLLQGTNYNLAITATTNKASGILHGDTIHSFLGLRLKANYETGAQELDASKANHIRNGFIVIDEASMIDYQLWEIIGKLCHNCKILLVGDKYQLPAVSASAKVFENYPISELTEVVRQKDQDFLQEIDNAKQGVIANTLYEPKANSCIKLFQLKDREEIKSILTTFTNKDKILCYTNKLAVEYAQRLRALQGKPNEMIIGDPVMNRYYCESIGGTKAHLYTEQELTIASLGEPKAIELGGEELLVQEVTFNEDGGTYIKALDNDHRALLTKKLARDKNWRDYFFLKEKVLDLRFNEACTIHCSQGSTYDRVFIDMSDIKKCKAHSVKARLLYVALSRAKNEVYIYDN